jgi:hypothetical protein
MIDHKDLINRFTYHPPKKTKQEGLDQKERYEEIRRIGMGMANTIHSLTPSSREQSLAITHLEDAVMWANAAIARNE